MKNKVLSIITLALTLLCTCCLFGCKKSDNSGSNSESNDETNKCLHENVDITKGYASTCTQTGLSDHKVCIDCGEVLSEQRVILKSIHNFENDYTCTICNTTITPSQGFEYEYSEEEEGYIITGIGTCSDKDIYIPFTYKKSPVVAISNGAFANCYFISSITLSNNIRYVDYYAFYNCIGLTRLVIGKNLTELPYGALVGCGKISEVYNLTDEEFTNEAFDGFGGIFRLYKPHVEAIHTSTSEASILENVDDYQFMTLDDEYYLIGYSGNNTKLTLPNNYRDNDYYIGKYAFANQINMTNVSIPNNVEGVLIDAFKEIYRGEYTIFLEYNEYENGRYLGNEENPYLILVESMGGCNVINENTKIIAPYAYLSNDTNEAFVVPDNVTFLGERSFLASNVHLGKSVEKIDSLAFQFELENLTVDKDNKYYKIVDGSLYTIDGTTLVKYLKGTNDSFTIPNEVTNIADYAFYGGSLVTLTIPDNAISLSHKSFYNTNVENVNYLGNIDTWLNISPYIIASLENLQFNGQLVTEITIPGSITEIPDGAFSNYSQLEKLYISEGVTKIGRSAFTKCSALEEITLPRSLRLVEYSAFGWSDYSQNTTVYYNGTLSDWLQITFADVLSTPFLGGNSSLYINGEKLVNLVIPKEITRINAFAFNGCTSIESITVHKDVSFVGKDAFLSSSKKVVYYEGDVNDWCNIEYGTYSDPALIGSAESTYDDFMPICYGADLHLNGTKLTHLVLPNDFHGQYFRGCTSIEELVIPNGITNINKYAFQNCTSLTSVVTPNSLRSIDYAAFNGCSSLRTITLGQNIEEISDSAFGDCYNLFEIYNLSKIELSLGQGFAENAFTIHSSIDTPSIIRYYGDFVFVYLSDNEIYLVDYLGEDDEVILPDSLDGKSYIIHAFAFAGNSNIKRIVISDGATSIMDRAFANCSYLARVEIGNNVASIGELVFDSCYSLHKVIIGKAVNTIGANIFKNCYKLYEVYNLSNVQISTYKNVTVHTSMLDESILDYMNDFVFANDILIDYTGKDTDVVLPESHNGKSYTIGDYFLYYDNNVTSVKFSNGVTAVGEFAFYSGALESIYFSNTVKSIGEGAFAYTPIKALELPNGLISIENGAFMGCAYLEHVTIPSSITHIDVGAFYRSNNIKSVNYLGTLEQYLNVVPYNNEYSLTPLKGELYLNGKLLTDVVIPDGITHIPYGFMAKATIKSLKIPNSVTHIGDWAFGVCKSLENVIIPSSVEYMGYNAFAECYVNIFFEHEKGTIDYTEVSKTNSVYWYSENKPTTPGNYWHYVFGIPVIWE